MMNDPLFQLVQKQGETEDTLDRLSQQEEMGGWGDLMGRHIGLPALRAFWPISSLNETPAVLDLSGQGRTLSGQASPSYAIYNDIITYVDLNGSTQWLFRADEAGLSITGSLTLGGWFWFDSVASTCALIGKLGASGNYSYEVFLHNTLGLGFQVSSNGTALAAVFSGVIPSVNTWCHVMGRYTASTAIDVIVNAVQYRSTSSIPASIFNNTSDFTIGARADAAARIPLDGRSSMNFICAAAVPDRTVKMLYRRGRIYFRN